MMRIAIACGLVAGFAVRARAGELEPPPTTPTPPPATPPPIDARSGAAAGAERATALEARSGAPTGASDLDLRLTLSSFLFRETGADAPPLVDMGATVPSASPVRRYFGDLRVELADGGFELDTRVRQTTSQRYQSGAAGGGEYEIRTLRLRIGSARTAVIVGRQVVDAVGATKVDGAAVVQRLSNIWSATLFGGAAPQLGSRSLDTDYPEIRHADGTSGSALIPITGGLGASYSTPNVHGDVGVAASYVVQDVPDAAPSEASRVTVTTSGYGRPARWIDIYHFGLVDVAGAAGVNLTNGSVGIDLHPTPTIQLTAAANHVSTDVLQVAARNLLVDPDPSAIGIVQNNIAVIRVSQDLVRAGASVALARSRFELSVTGGAHRRPGVAVALADGSAVSFAEARSADVTMLALDRRSIAKLRLSGSATLTMPIGSELTNRSRGTIVRLAASRSFRDGRGQLEADVMAERFRDLSGGGMCTGSLDVFGCFGASKTSAVQAGALGSWRVAREWLVLIDAHVGARAVTSTSSTGAVDYPTAYSVTTFARVQWRYR